MQTWPKEGPKLSWTYGNAGQGYSCPVIVAGRLYLTGGRGDSEYLFALEVKGGAPKELWAAKIGPLFTWEGNSWNAGPGATPLVDGGLVYALGGQGDLICVEAADGQERWRKSLPRDLGGEVNPVGGGAKEPTPLGWGFNGSPLVDGDQLICVPGGKDGAVAALDKKTGNVRWRSNELTEQASYSSPIVALVGGIRQYIQMTNLGVAGVAAKDGRLLWYYKRKKPWSEWVIATPVFHDNHVFVTVGHGFGPGCELIRLTPEKDGIKAELAYANPNMQNQEGGVVLVGAHVYGYSNRRGWTALDLKSGKVVWSEKELEAGSIIYADGRLYCLEEEEGIVVLALANPDGWKEHGRFKLPQASKLRKSRGKVWTPPVIADGKLYLRDQDLLFCYDIKQNCTPMNTDEHR